MKTLNKLILTIMLLGNTSNILGDWKERMIPGYETYQQVSAWIRHKPITC